MPTSVLLEPSDRIAFQNGRWIEASGLSLSVSDLAVTHAATAVERVRLYYGRLFQIDRHLDRWQRSVDTLMIDGLPSRDEMRALMESLVAKNQSWMQQNPQCGLVMFASPGMASTGAIDVPTLVIDLYPIDPQVSKSRQQLGSPLVVTSIQQQSDQTWPRDIKVRSRLHYYLADRHARRTVPGAFGVLVDADGTITDTSVANVLIVEEGVLISPHPGQILPGITLQVVQELAKASNLSWSQDRIKPERLRSADEVLLTGTTDGVWFASSIDSGPRHPPGPLYRQLRSAFDGLIQP